MTHQYMRFAGATALVCASIALAQTGGGGPTPAPPAPAPAQNPATPAPNPATPAQNPATPAPNPAIPAQNPAIPAPKPPTPPQNPAVPSQNPAIPSQNPAIPAQNPAIPSQNPAIPTQNPAVPPQNPAIPPSNPAIPSQSPGTPQKPAAPGQPGSAVQPSSPNRPTQPVAAGSPAAPLSPQAQLMLTGLGGVNLQTAVVRTTTGVGADLTGGQINALIQAVGGNPQIQQKAAGLTRQLRQQRTIGDDQQVVGYDNGRVLVVTNAQVAAAGRANGATTALTPQMNALVTNLAGINAQTFTVQGVTSANTLFNQDQVSALFDAIRNNPQARPVADRLTLNLFADGLIRGNQRVIGVQDGRAIVTALVP
jgi:hypothetical protein